MIDFSTFKKLTVNGVDLKTLAINGVEVWKAGITNWVPISKDTDGSVFNNVGYIEGYRLSSNGSLKEQKGSAATGFIPYKMGDIVRMSGAQWSTTVSAGYVYILFYDSNFNYLSHINRYMNGSATDRGISNAASTVNKNTSSILTNSGGVTTFNVNFTKTLDIAYIRISATANGEDMIITVNETIDSVSTNLLETVIVNLNSRYNSSNVLVEATGYIAIDYTTVRNGDVLRFKPSTLINGGGNGYQRLRCYNSSGTLVSATEMRIEQEYPVTISNNIATLTIPTIANENYSYANIVKMRMNLFVADKTISGVDLENLIITINEEIEA